MGVCSVGLLPRIRGNMGQVDIMLIIGPYLMRNIGLLTAGWLGGWLDVARFRP